MMSPILLLFILFTSFHSSSSSSNYLKLRLQPTLPFPTPQQALTLDTIRLSSLSSSSSSSPIISGASTGAGQYLVDFHVGSPPQLLHLVADTGSDLVWVRCSPCVNNCSLHHPPNSSFFPRHSSTFSPFHCYSPSCRLVQHPSPSPTCNHTRLHTPCRYFYSYADRSYSSGFFSREVAAQKLPIDFGCAFNVSRKGSLRAANGVMGLGRGAISFASQVGKQYGNKFSYCLMDYTLSPPPTSYLIIGNNNNNYSDNSTGLMSFTPLQTNPLSPTFYYIRVIGASVDGNRLPIHHSVWAIDVETGSGGTIVDSGTTLSFLPRHAYTQIVAAMQRKLHALAVAGPPEFDLCVNTTSSTNIKLPRLGLRLLGGAELSPPPRNYFVEVEEGVKCLALQPVSSTGGLGFGVIGNLMQQGFLFVFDRDASRLGFSRTGCAASL